MLQQGQGIPSIWEGPRQIQGDMLLKDKYNLNMLNKQELEVPGRKISKEASEVDDIQFLGPRWMEGTLALLGVGALLSDKA